MHLADQLTRTDAYQLRSAGSNPPPSPGPVGGCGACKLLLPAWRPSKLSEDASPTHASIFDAFSSRYLLLYKTHKRVAKRSKLCDARKLPEKRHC